MFAALALATFSKDYPVVAVNTPGAAKASDAEIEARYTQACVIVGRSLEGQL
jgi:hypothetical protein